MTANHDWLHPSWNWLGNTIQYDGLTEHGSAKNITDLICLLKVGEDSLSDTTLTVPFGLFHISLSLNSSTRASSGVIVAHLMPTLCSRMALAASTVTRSSVFCRVNMQIKLN